MAGSKADIPKDLLAQIVELENLFIVNTQKLKQITDHFIRELDKGKEPSLHPAFSSKSLTALIRQ